MMMNKSTEVTGCLWKHQPNGPNRPHYSLQTCLLSKWIPYFFFFKQYHSLPLLSELEPRTVSWIQINFPFLLHPLHAVDST